MDLAYLAELPREEFITRRKKVFAQMQDNSAFIIFTETEKRRNNDCNTTSVQIAISGISPVLPSQSQRCC